MFERIKAYLRNRRYERERKKFIRKWNEDNKNWCECRHKRKAFKRAMIKTVIRCNQTENVKVR